MGRFEILEHTADVGVRAVGASPEEAFEQATRGLADIVGIWQPDGGEEVPIEVEDGRVKGVVVLKPRGERVPEGTQVKAVTYHRLRVEKVNGDWVVEVYLD